MNCLAWSHVPDTAALARAIATQATPLYLIVCLPDDSVPEFRLSATPDALEQTLYRNLTAQLGCIQFNGANVLENILPNVHLWLMPSETATRLGEHFPMPLLWQTEAVPQKETASPKPWFRPSENRAAPTRALIIGAGIAGAATAHALAQHGLPVTVLEATEPATAASGNRQGLLYAKISPHNTEQTELLLCGYGHTRRLLQNLLPEQNDWGGNGILHLNYDNEETRRNRLLSEQSRHSHLYRAVSADESTQIAGIPIAQSGLYWPQGVWLHPPALVRALLDHPLIEVHSQSPVLSAEHNGHSWQVHTPKRIFSGSHLVYCTGAHSPHIADTNIATLPYRLIRGQTDLAPATPYSQQLRCALSGTSYISPAWQGWHGYGATFVQHDTDTDWREADRQTNLLNLQTLNSELAAELAPPSRSDGLNHIPQGHAALRCDSPDHLPIVGALGDIQAMQNVYAKLALDKNYRIRTTCPYLPDAYINTAHGSRGLSTAPICAAAVAADILGLPNPLSQRIRTALSPNRLIIRALIRQQPLSVSTH
ncbi:FAD-dependent 5-carboxymethylaminomethyl-2-thiouridine(34) oxidoreductase MnmC [Neisseria montereyensis]|uniref:FAD-dependent 5-carboxymethylaminomethyl-2-thiouridine(34) oxidoreductase MnmC n=1 Tax=Neisseria montereyensis TaxID=2973938 RepID=A0ABT2F9B1_9NEIS|nr:FAD-dependent 5-carboxymethylaminomethyl-2-thiouridine(34) oxidoreductase MnmC [Neisseria montereyensis]MCS4532791.1 FAD-dependent 5-carboxymethylaminomethyl-2-thiouridine(34) oxidoreductase MnmC [Neisseria montereyensis]